MKKILWTLGLLILLLVVGVMLLIKIYVTPQRVQNMVREQLEKNLQRQVLVGEVEVGWLSGIRLDGLRIADGAGEHALLAAERIELSYDYLALLHGELLIGQILILQPQLRLMRDVEGHWNIDDLLKKTSEASSVDRSAQKLPAKREGAFALQLLVRKLQIEGGRLQLLDYFEKKQPPTIYKIENLNLRLNDFSLHQSFVTEIEARLNGARLAAEIGYHLDKGLESAELEIKQLDVLPLVPSAPSWLQQGQLDGTLSYRDETLQTRGLQLTLNGQRLDIDLDGTQLLSSAVRWDVRLRSEHVDMDKLLPAPAASTGGSDSVHPTMAEKGDQIRLPVALPLNLKLQLAIQHLIYQGIAAENLTGQVRVLDNRVQLDELQLSLAEGRVQLDGEMQLHTRGWPYSGQLKAQQVELGRLADVLLPKGKGSISGLLDLAGPFEGLAGVADVSTAVQTRVEFDLRNGEIKGSPLFAEMAAFLANPELELLGFSRFYGQIDLDKGQGILNARLESRKAVFIPQGTFSLAGPIDMKLETHLAPQMFKRTGLSGNELKYLQDDQGWTLLPLRVKGRYDRPRMSLDEGGAKQQLGQQLGQELERQLDKRLKDKNSEQRQQLENLLQNSIKHLLK